VKAAAIVVDSEVLHRGGRTPDAVTGSCATSGWVSSLSVELCSPSGWAAWETFNTGGTTKDPSSTEDWRMLCIKRQGQHVNAAHDPTAVHLPSASPVLDVAPWTCATGLKRLRVEQQEWEFGE